MEFLEVVGLMSYILSGSLTMNQLQFLLGLVYGSFSLLGLDFRVGFVGR